MEITAFTDCDSNSIVVRMPYELIVSILEYLPADKGGDELLRKVSRAAQRSNRLTDLLKDCKEREREANADTHIRLWLKKLLEEYREAAIEAGYGNTEALAMELQDIIHVCTTWQEVLGYNLDKRQALCQRVNFKNFKRGYFSLNGSNLSYSFKRGLFIAGSENEK